MSLATRIAQEFNTVRDEIDAVPRTMADIAKNTIQNIDSVSIDDFTLTKHFAVKEYTGNGTSQDIVTGINSVDFTVASNGCGYYLVRDSANCLVADASLELITNGTFNTDISNWTGNTSNGTTNSFSYSSGTMSVSRGGSAWGYGEPYQAITCEVGKTYVLTCDVSTNPCILIADDNIWSGTPDSSSNTGGTGKKALEFTATATTMYVGFLPSAGGTTSNIDNVSVKEAQDLSTPITFDWGTNKGVSQVHIKALDIAYSNLVIDGLRGANGVIYTDLTNAEVVSGTKTFNSDGFTVDSSLVSNADTKNFIAYQTLYTHGKASLTSQGKLQIEMYNPVTKMGMIYYLGSGTAGHQISHSMGVEIDFWVNKGLNSATNGYANTQTLSDGTYLPLNDSSAETSSVNSSDANSKDIQLGTGSTMNGSGGEYILYYKCKSDYWDIVEVQTSSTEDTPVYGSDEEYLFTADTAMGDYIYIFIVDKTSNNEVVRLTRKGINVASSWNTYDYARGLNERIEYDTSDIATSDTLMNNHIAASSDPTYPHPTDDSNLNLSGSIFHFTDGKDENGFTVSKETITGSIDFAGVDDGLCYPTRVEGSSWEFPTRPLSYGLYEKESADDNGYVFNPDDGKIYSTTGGELVTNGTFDTDTSGWTGGTFDSGTVKLDASNTSHQQLTGLTVGEEYTISYQFVYNNDTSRQAYMRLGTTGSSSFDVYDGNVSNKLYSSYGTYEVKFIATSTIVDITLIYNYDASPDYCQFDNITCYKSQATLDTAVTTPISFLTAPVMVASETPQYIGDEEIAENYMYSTHFGGLVNLSENRKVIDIGTVYNDNRYVIDNPFGNKNYMDCSVRIELFINNRWSDPSWAYLGQLTQSRGTRAHSNAEGIVVQTGDTHVSTTSINSGGGHNSTGNNSSAPARVIVTYIGEAK